MQIDSTGPNRCGKRRIWITAAAILAVLIVVGIFYRRFLLSGLDLVAEATGSRTSAALCLALALLVLVWLLVWLLFPVFVYFGLRDLRRRTAELDRTMKLCVPRLTQNPAEPATTKVEDVPREKGPTTSA